MVLVTFLWICRVYTCFAFAAAGLLRHAVAVVAVLGQDLVLRRLSYRSWYPGSCTRNASHRGPAPSISCASAAPR